MHALSFNADISSWNVSSVEYAPLAFYAASSFRTDLSNWNVSKMKDVTKIVRVLPNMALLLCTSLELVLSLIECILCLCLVRGGQESR